jgi:ABC-type lipoprotein export system ATPase subunit
MTNNNTAVRIEDVTRAYSVNNEQVLALRGVNMSIERGTFTAFMGRSGSGKTTLLNMIGGLDTPTSGNIYFLGQNTATLSQDQLTDIRRDKIGFIFQAFALLPILSAWENVELPLRISGVKSGKERRQRALEALTLVGLEQWADHRPSEMSGGQQQRVAIARALVSRPPILIADEPTGELDSTTGKNLMTLMRTIVKSEGVTLIMATHDQSVHQYADIVHHMRDGQVYESIAGTIEDAAAGD